MDEKKKELMNRIRKLEDWQKSMILVDFFFDADEKQVQNIAKQVVLYERINGENEVK